MLLITFGPIQKQHIEYKPLHIRSILLLCLTAALIGVLYMGIGEKPAVLFAISPGGNNIYTIITHVFVHVDSVHLFNNLAFLIPTILFLIFHEGPSVLLTLLLIALAQGAAVWTFGESNVYYAGASGLGYGAGFYLLFQGMISFNRTYLIFSVSLFLIYIHVFVSFMNEGVNVSDLSHVAGTLSGIASSIAHQVVRKARFYK